MIAEEAYAEVERLTRRRARNFAYGIMLLPREKRRAIDAQNVAEQDFRIESRRI